MEIILFEKTDGGVGLCTPVVPSQAVIDNAVTVGEQLVTSQTDLSTAQEVANAKTATATAKNEEYQTALATALEAAEIIKNPKATAAQKQAYTDAAEVARVKQVAAQVAAQEVIAASQGVINLVATVSEAQVAKTQADAAAHYDIMEVAVKDIPEGCSFWFVESDELPDQTDFDTWEPDHALLGTPDGIGGPTV